jgi:ribosomal protein S18 acetylase RimI-like enzyme
MNEAPSPVAITIRPAVSEDADGIARAFVESAEYHTRLDPKRYLTPAVGIISARYREGRQHQADGGEEGITLVAELSREIVGFVDARLEQSPDAMHREITYCHVAEIAVSSRHQKQGIGERLLRAVEDWDAGRVRSSHRWNITPQTRAPALSISGAWVLRCPHHCDQASLV